MNLDIIPVKWTDEGVAMLDQRLLPTEEKWLMLKTYNDVAAGIKDMVVRGAPAIGVSAAYGIALGAKQFVGTDVTDLEDELDYISDVIGKTRPTAVNLFWAIDRMKRLYASLNAQPVEAIREALVREAKQIRLEDIAINEAIGQNGAGLVPDGKTVLTHCNAGALATAGFGTALGVIRAAIASGKKVDVFADETRALRNQEITTGTGIVDRLGHCCEHLAGQIGIDAGDQRRRYHRSGHDFVGRHWILNNVFRQ